MTQRDRPIAVFTASMGGGGAERVMVRLATGLAKRGYPTDLVLARHIDCHTYVAELTHEVRLVPLGASHALLSTSALARYLRREQPLALISAIDYVNVIALVAGRLSRSKSRFVVSEHNTISVKTQNAKQHRERWLPALVRRTYPWADVITAVSEGVAKDLARTVGIADEQIVVIDNPVIVPEMSDLAHERCDHPWLRPGHDVPVALAVGRLAPQKDYETLMRAFARARERHDARLLILGEGPERPGLEALAGELGLTDDVQLPGWVDNAYAYMTRADTFVLSSRWEGLPTVLIEALFCGIPIVATDCPSGPREILAGGRFGRLVPVRDVKRLADSLTDALDGKVPSAGPDSWRRYDRDVVVDRYLDLALGA